MLGLQFVGEALADSSKQGCLLLQSIQAGLLTMLYHSEDTMTTFCHSGLILSICQLSCSTSQR